MTVDKHTKDYANHLVSKHLNSDTEHTKIGGKLKDSNKTTRDINALIKLAENIKKTTRIIDYGCGTLRIGIPLIKFLDEGNYFGADVSNDILQKCVELLGKDLLSHKKPFFKNILEESFMSEASKHQADLVFSYGVSFHVHNNELEYYCNNIKNLAHKKSCRIALQTIVSKSEFQFHKYGWSRRLDTYLKIFKPFEPVKINLIEKRQRAGQETQTIFILFSK